MRQVTWNENVIADRRSTATSAIGTRACTHCARRAGTNACPSRETGGRVARLPAPQQTPHVINPEAGLARQLEQRALARLDQRRQEARERLTGPLHRVRILQTWSRKVAENPSYEQVAGIVKKSGTQPSSSHSSNFKLPEHANRHARRNRPSDPPPPAHWDGNYTTTDADGTVDPGVAIWEEFKDQLERSLASAAKGPRSSPANRVSHQFDITNGEVQALRPIGAEGYAKPRRDRRGVSKTHSAAPTRLARTAPASTRVGPRVPRPHRSCPSSIGAPGTNQSRWAAPAADSG